MKKHILLLAIFALALASGCYINADVSASQVGVKLNRNKIIECVGPGVYTEGGWFQDLKTISQATITFSVEDPEVATKNNQTAGIRVTIQARRKSDCDSAKNILTNWPSLTNDDQLQVVITKTALEGLKNGTRSFEDVNSLLNDRNALATAIRSALETDASKYSTEIINVTIENIAPDPAYLATYNERAQIEADKQKELKRQDLINQVADNATLEQERRGSVLDAQLLAEKKQTDISVEIAGRKGKEIAAENQVYLDNERAYTLKLYEAMARIFNDKTSFWFLDRQTPLSLILDQLTGQAKSVIPVAPQPTP